MKFAMYFLLFCVALAAAAPQFLTTFPGYVGVVVKNCAEGPVGVPFGARTLVTGPTVLNGAFAGAWPGRFLAPGIYGI